MLTNHCIRARLSFRIKGLRKQLEEYCIFEGLFIALIHVKEKSLENMYMELSRATGAIAGMTPHSV
ncbi:hypothetical protein TKWG_14120 [Advenella kashmirensis WT001]|uniref:Uncharacterized protein n=1 Tax=Advenella kashmirensis (strain DSM 17095 / LMG 22695 / WT001) TaxID=1036672 RepID=I3UD14_ADVKW|nr:hypothetical protein TKWG_14120 [Advenella kashmirensis WT001]